MKAASERPGLRTREEIASVAPPGYSFRRHAISVHVLALGTVAAALACLRGPGAADLVLVPAGAIFANLFEYLLHRFAMHRPVRGLGIFFERHTLVHHAYFRRESMRASSTSEMRFVLFPAWAFPLMIALTAPVHVGVGLALGRDSGLVFLSTAVLYYLLYEWLHACYHLASIEALGRIPILGKAAARHALHHDPARMTQANFNITFPIFDTVLGTKA